MYSWNNIKFEKNNPHIHLENKQKDIKYSTNENEGIINKEIVKLSEHKKNIFTYEQLGKYENKVVMKNVRYVLKNNKYLLFNEIKIENNKNLYMYGLTYDIILIDNLLTVGCKTYPIKNWLRWNRSGALQQLCKQWGDDSFWIFCGEWIADFIENIAKVKQIVLD